MNISIRSFQDTVKNDRVDAEYFKPMYEEVVKRFQRNSKTVTLENITKLIGHPSNPPYASEDSRSKTFVITQKRLGNYFPPIIFSRYCYGMCIIT